MAPSARPLIIEEQFKTMADMAPVMLWVSDSYRSCYFFNTGWLRFTGRTHEQEYGDGRLEGIHPDDLQRYLGAYINSFDARTEFKVEYRLKRNDGVYHWILDNGVPRYTADGAFAGYIGSCIDINELLESEKLRSAHIGAEAMEKEQTLNEELTSTNEELAAINDELATTNEELTATNEELKLSRENLRKLNEELEERVINRSRALIESEANFRNMILQAPVAMGLFTGPNMVLDIINDQFLDLWHKDRSVIGKPVMQALPEMKGQPYPQIMLDVYHTGEPYHGTESKVFLERHGQLEEGYYNFINHPFHNNEGIITGIIVVAIDVTDQVRSRLELQRAEEMLRFSVEAANAATWHMDAQTREFIPSQRLKEIFGFPPDAVINYEDVLAQIPDDYKERIHTAVQRSIVKGESYIMEHPIVGFDQKNRWVRALGKLYTAGVNGRSHFSGLIIDITEQKQDELRKNDFIGMVSHELKTPLTSLSAYVQLLQAKAKKDVDGFTENALDKVNKQVKKMSVMINGFLNVSRLEAGKIIINKHDFNLDELLNEAIDDTMLIITSHTIRFLPCEPVKVNADKDKINSVISNLLSNAIKYSPKGKTVEVKCEVQDNMAMVSIKDEGIGIKPKDQAKLFERYYRAENDHTQHISGFGIGLYLSAEIIYRHSGEIGVESELEEGSTFWFTLPLVS